MARSKERHVTKLTFSEQTIFGDDGIQISRRVPFLFFRSVFVYHAYFLFLYSFFSI